MGDEEEAPARKVFILNAGEYIGAKMRAKETSPH